MERDPDTIRILQDINVAIGAIYDLMQRQEDRTRSNTTQMGGGPSQQAPSPGQETPDILHQSRQNFLGGMFGGMFGGMGMMGRPYMPFGMPSMSGMSSGSSSAPSYGYGGFGFRGSSSGSGELNTIFQKLVEVLEKLNNKLNYVGGVGGGGGGNGLPATASNYSGLQTANDMQMIERQRRLKMIDDMKKQYDLSVEKKQTGEDSASVLRHLGGAISHMAGGAQRMAATGDATHGIAGMGGSIGTILSMFGPKGAAIGAGIAGAAQIPNWLNDFSTNMHNMNMRLGDYSPSMAAVRAYSHVEKIQHEQRLGEGQAAGARLLAEARAASARASEPRQKVQSDVGTYFGSVWETVKKDFDEGMDPTKAGLKGLGKLFNPSEVADHIIKLKELEEKLRLENLANPSTYFKDIAAKKFEEWERPNHWKP